MEGRSSGSLQSVSAAGPRFDIGRMTGFAGDAA
jgi:hypothetical protein